MFSPSPSLPTVPLPSLRSCPSQSLSAQPCCQGASRRPSEARTLSSALTRLWKPLSSVRSADARLPRSMRRSATPRASRLPVRCLQRPSAAVLSAPRTSPRPFSLFPRSMSQPSRSLSSLMPMRSRPSRSNTFPAVGHKHIGFIPVCFFVSGNK